MIIDLEDDNAPLGVFGTKFIPPFVDEELDPTYYNKWGQQIVDLKDVTDEFRWLIHKFVSRILGTPLVTNLYCTGVDQISPHTGYYDEPNDCVRISFITGMCGSYFDLWIKSNTIRVHFKRDSWNNNYKRPVYTFNTYKDLIDYMENLLETEW